MANESGRIKPLIITIITRTGYSSINSLPFPPSLPAPTGCLGFMVSAWIYGFYGFCLDLWISALVFWNFRISCIFSLMHLLVGGP
jgi:hypothetical protein